MKRRQLLLGGLPLALQPDWATAAAVQAAEEPAWRMATAWRVASTSAPDTGDRVGVFRVDWAAGQLQIQAEQAVPSRAHGLLSLADGGFLAVAARPGRWLLRCDAQGDVMQRWAMADDSPQRSFDGHAQASADGAWIYTGETDPATGAGWISVRDARTLQRVAQFGSGGVDPHQLTVAGDGQLLVANGGIVRDVHGRKIAPERMDSSLVRLDGRDGRLLGQWRLPDARLSMRHLAWAQGPTALLGIALQAEHDLPEQRAQAPVLALWDGQDLVLPSADNRGGGYAGDITAAPGGGFVLSAQKQRMGLWWHPSRPAVLTRMAELSEPCALMTCSDGDGVVLGAARGLARWHLHRPARLLSWPTPLGPDNHAVRLAA
ncbi:MAG TPA: DUF1513 domain-containing protein [Rubrivivax sp.]|nr:DUF1513 domain-containing protein [Rubrivivax sp.]